MKELTPAHRATVLLTLAATIDPKRGSKLPHGAYVAVATRLGHSTRTVRRLWKAHGHRATDPNLIQYLGNRRKGKCGQKPIDVVKLQAAVAAAPLEARHTYRSTAHATGFARSTIWDKVGRGDLRAHTTRLKPALTAASRAARLNYCLDKIQADVDAGMARFHNFEDTVFLDEKWFFVDVVRRTYVLAPYEDAPTPTTRHKSHIVKVMLLAAVARPRHDRGRNRAFDGKLGIWPFVVETVAVRSSKNRPRGAPVVTPTTVDRDAYWSMLLRCLVPAILTKWPKDSIKTIKLQQDNAGPHLPAGAFWSGRGLALEIVCQPASSPDFNILDLGYFNSIQALQQKRRCKSVVELVQVVKQSFVDLPRFALENVFYTLFRCMEASMLVGGLTTYVIPRANKAKLRKTPGALDRLELCSSDAVVAARAALNELS
jgi:hypothetical protein